MNQNVNINTVTIKSTSTRVWEAITTTSELSNYMDNMKVMSDWKVGADIEFSCYNPDGSIMLWEDKEVGWKGKIVVFEVNKVFSVEYDGSGDLLKETYEIKELDDQTVELTFTQEAIDEEVAENYKKGNDFTLQSLKRYLENQKTTQPELGK